MTTPARTLRAPPAFKGLRIARRRILARLRSLRARAALRNAPSGPAWLGPTDLDRLQGDFAQVPWSRYDPASTLERGLRRAREVIRAVGGKRFSQAGAVLEVGCYDGMVSYWLSTLGRKCTAVDVVAHGFDSRARAAGVAFVQADAARLDFPDASFDVVFSFDTMEHVTQPDAVLHEMARVLRPGGVAHLSFGPLYMSAFGLHAEGIRVPYCQHLFTTEALDEYLRTHGLPALSSTPVNGWPLARYRQAFNSCGMAGVRHYEVFDSSHVDLIARYPACFRARCVDIDEFLVAGLDVTLRRP
jgi:ubiquinone/menaquinone biosynthesis C-methylase UbiE